MKRIALTLVVVALFSAVTYYVVTHPNLGKAQRLSEEYEKLAEQNRQLAQQNSELERKIVALRDDPRLAERRAREAVALARPNEIIFQFEEPQENIAMQVLLTVDNKTVTLAGKNIDIIELGRELELLKTELPGAQLSVQLHEDISAIRQQRIIDIIDASPFASAVDE